MSENHVPVIIKNNFLLLLSLNKEKSTKFESI